MGGASYSCSSIKVILIRNLNLLEDVYLDVVVEEVGLQIVHTEFQCSETLVDERLGPIEGGDQGVHQHVEIGEEGTETDRNCQA